MFIIVEILTTAILVALLEKNISWCTYLPHYSRYLSYLFYTGRTFISCFFCHFWHNRRCHTKNIGLTASWNIHTLDKAWPIVPGSVSGPVKWKALDCGKHSWSVFWKGWLLFMYRQMSVNANSMPFNKKMVIKLVTSLLFSGCRFGFSELAILSYLCLSAAAPSVSIF